MSRRPRRRPTLKAPEPIGGLVGRVRYGTGPERRPNLSREVWEAVVGARIADRAQPIELDRGTLIVRVATSVWASELSLLSVPVLARLRAAGVEVTAMRCRVGVVEAPVRVTALRHTRAVPPPLPIPASLARVLSTVDDLELRTAISAAASANLAWQSYVGEERASDERATGGGSRAARVPQSSERESGPPAQTTAAARGATRRTP